MIGAISSITSRGSKSDALADTVRVDLFVEGLYVLRGVVTRCRRADLNLFGIMD